MELSQAHNKDADSLLSLQIKEKELSQRILDLEDELLSSKLLMFEIISRFVPNRILHIFKKESIRDVSLGESVDREMAILFSDIRSYATMSENMDSQQVFRFLNSYFRRMVPVIEKNRGYIDKFIGDAILAVFPDNVDDAVRSAIKMIMALSKFNRAVTLSQHLTGNENLKPINIGIGLHWGKMTLGMIGSKSRIESTVVGDTVNIAARIESLTKMFQIPIIITSTIFKNLKDPSQYFLREIDTVRVKGKEEPITLYEVYDTNSELIREKKVELMPFFMNGLVMFKTGEFKESIESFSECLKELPDDPIPKIYLKRCQTFIRIPPSGEWRGISSII